MRHLTKKLRMYTLNLGLDIFEELKTEKVAHLVAGHILWLKICNPLGQMLVRSQVD